MRLGSLCSGYGGLDLAAESVFGAETVWHCEIDAAAAKVLERRWPAIPNHRDLTTVDWESVEPVDVLTAGYPCQPFSSAGQRKGADDERHIWPFVREAIRRVRPRVTVLENVAGHRSLGFDRVLGDLAEDGMYVRWTSLRAADVGAPHSRERVFLLVSPNAQGHQGRVRDGNGAATSDGDSASGEARRGRQGAGNARRPQPVVSSDAAIDLLPTPKAHDGEFGTPRTSGRPVEKSTHLGTIVSLLPMPKANEGSCGCYNSPGHQDTLSGTVRLLPTPKAYQRGDCPSERERHDPDLTAITYYTQQWGKYEPAIRRWEQVTRPAPAPTEPNAKGNPRLSARFAEWMMGLPAGWVTDVDLPRSAHLKILGNGVVPQQATAALSWLLGVSEVAA